MDVWRKRQRDRENKQCDIQHEFNGEYWRVPRTNKSNNKRINHYRTPGTISNPEITPGHVSNLVRDAEMGSLCIIYNNQSTIQWLSKCIYTGITKTPSWTEETKRIIRIAKNWDFFFFKKILRYVHQYSLKAHLKTKNEDNRRAIRKPKNKKPSSKIRFPGH